MELNLMTFNVQHFENYTTHEIDYCLFARVMLQSGAHVIGVNEIYAPQAEIMAEKLGWQVYFAKATELSGGRAYGNAVFSRLPFLSCRTVPIPDPPVHGYGGYYETRCAAVCEIGAGEHTFTLVQTHFGLNPDEHENAAATVTGLLKSERCVLMGDLNVTPENPVLAPIRAKMTDAAEAFAAPRLSFPSDAPEEKIDYIFVSPDLTVLEADIPNVIASDHLPHTAKIRI